MQARLLVSGAAAMLPRHTAVPRGERTVSDAPPVTDEYGAREPDGPCGPPAPPGRFVPPVQPAPPGRSMSPRRPGAAP
ncbi:hypothetical protein BJY54_002969 [Streptomyces nodosus]|nr:hypothetical protein [Streptomyces nodosus]